MIKPFVILAGSSALVQALPLLALPLLSRLVSVEDFGAFTIFSTVITALSIFTTGRWEYAILAESTDGDSRRLVDAITAFCLLFSASLGLLVLPLLRHFECPGISLGEWLAAVSLLGMRGYITALSMRFNRISAFSRLASSRLIQTVTSTAAGLFFAFAGLGVAALISGMLVGHAFQTCYLMRVRRQIDPAPPYAWHPTKDVLRRNLRYPRFLVAAGIFEQISFHLPVLFLSALFSPAATGQWGACQRLFATPCNILVSALVETFRPHAAAGSLDAPKRIRLTALCALTSFLLALPLFLSTALAAPSIAETVLGSEWRPAGDFAALFSPILLLSAIVSPISIFLYLLNRQDLDFRLQAFRLAASFLGMLAGYALMPTPSGLLLGYVLATALKYLVEFSLIWFTVKSAPPTESR